MIGVITQGFRLLCLESQPKWFMFTKVAFNDVTPLSTDVPGASEFYSKRRGLQSQQGFEPWRPIDGEIRPSPVAAAFASQF